LEILNVTTSTLRQPKPKTLRRVRLLEHVSGPSQGLDKKNRVIRGAKLLGPVSRNRRRYTDRALQEAAALMEGAKVFCNHKHPARPGRFRDRQMNELFGVVKNVRCVKGQGVFGDVHYLESCPAAGQILEAIETDPRSCGFSIHAHSTDVSETSDGTEVVNGIESVRSVDLVTEPATSGGIFESIADGTDPLSDAIAAVIAGSYSVAQKKKAINIILALQGKLSDAGDDPSNLEEEEDGDDVEETIAPGSRTPGEDGAMVEAFLHGFRNKKVRDGILSFGRQCRQAGELFEARRQETVRKRRSIELREALIRNLSGHAAADQFREQNGMKPRPQQMAQVLGLKPRFPNNHVKEILRHCSR
jgi:hypothetical protein